MHNSYLAEVDDPLRLGAQSRIVQAVCSPIRNPMPRGVRAVMSLFAKSLVRPMRFVASRSPAGARPGLPVDGHRRAVVRQQHRARDACGPTDLDLTWVTGVVEDDPGHPRLQQVYAARLDPLPPRAGVRVGSGSVQG